MARSLPYSSCDELPIFASQETPAAINKLISTPSPRQANENHRKPRRWAEARSFDNIGNDLNLKKDAHLSQPPFCSKRPQQSSCRTFPSPGNSQLLSNSAVVSFNNRNLPELPKEEDFRPRTNSFEYNDESRFFSSYIIRRHQYPSPPPRKIAPQRCLSKIIKPKTGGKTEKSSVAHPDSLVPGKSGRRIDVTEAVYRSSAFQQKLDLNDSQKQRSHSSISSYTSPRTSNPSQKSFPFSKSYSHPMMSRDKPWGNTMIERPSTSGYNHVVTSASDKPLPFVPSKDTYQREEENENHLKDECCQEELFEIESSIKSTGQDYDEIEWKTTFLDNISEPNSNSTSIDTNHTNLSKPQLPNLSRISIFGTEIFSHLDSENLHTNLKDVEKSPTVKLDLKLLPSAESNLDSDTQHVSDKAARSKTLLSCIKNSVDNAGSLSSNAISNGSVISSGPNNTTSEIKSQDLNNISKTSLGDTLEKIKEDNDRNSLEMEVIPRKESIRDFCEHLPEKTNAFIYDDGSSAINPGNTQPELDSISYSSNLLLASDHQIITKEREKEEVLDKPSLVSIKNSTVSKSALKRENAKNDEKDAALKAPLSNRILRLEKIQEPSELNDKSAISFSQEFLDTNIAIETVNNTMEKLEKYHSIAQHTSTKTNTDILPFDLKVTSIISAHEIETSKKFEPPDHENINEARKSEISENSMHSELCDKLTIDSTLESVSYCEDEKLQQDIVKSINLHHDDGEDNLNQVPELLNCAEDHMNMYLPSEYDNYWASTTDFKRERYSIANTSQISIEKNFKTLPMELSEDKTLFVAPLSPKRKNDSAMSHPQVSISTQYPLEDDSHFVSPISILSPQSDFICELRDNTPVSPISVVSDSSDWCKAQSDLDLANDSYLTYKKKTISLEMSNQRDFKSHDSPILDNFEKNCEKIDGSFTQTENARNFQSFLLDQDLSYTAQPTATQLTKSSLHDISLEKSCTKKDINLTTSIPIQCESSYSTIPLRAGRLPSFRETLTLKSSQQKIQTFDEMREIFANFDIGLSIWIRELKEKHSEYQNSNSLLNKPNLYETGTHTLSREKLTNSNYIAHSPQNEHFINVNLTSLPLSSSMKFNVKSNFSNTQNIHPTNKLKSQQVQSKGKELFHTAGILSGKAGKAGKGLLAKGKNKLLSTGGGDKID